MNIIIIGATSGIGNALAERYAQNPNTKVGITGRRSDRLEALKEKYPNQIETQSFDVTAPDTLDSLQSLMKKMGKIDLIVYSSGYGARSEHFDWKITEQTLNINVIAFTKIANFAFEYFQTQGGGHFSAIASIAGYRGLGDNNGYSASKSFMITYLEDLRVKSMREKLNIFITTLIPGFVDTDLIEAKDTLFWIASKEKAAKQIFLALQKKKSHVFITKRWGLIAFILKYIPTWILAKLC